MKVLTVVDDVNAEAGESLPSLPSTPRYRVLEQIGVGGIGEVYAAYDAELDRRVALKVLVANDAAAVALLRREATTMARLSHPNVVRVFDVGLAGDRLFIAMEFVRGHDLRTWLATRPRTWPEIREVFVAAGHGLAAAHREGVSHRDFKPDNVLVDDDGHARVVDFGLAAAHGDVRLPRESVDGESAIEVTHSSDPLLGGTPRYMAPECNLGQPGDARSDQYSFCVALFEAIYGRPPFHGRTWQTLSVQVGLGLAASAVRTTAREIPRHVRMALLRGLAATPDRRFPDMDSLLAVLSQPAPTRKPWRRALGAGTATACLGLTVWWWWPMPSPAPAPVSDVCTVDPSRCTHKEDPRAQALQSQLELARSLRHSGRTHEAQALLKATAAAAQTALSAEHPLRRELDREQAELAVQP